jgi:hypothetical protein
MLGSKLNSDTAVAKEKEKASGASSTWHAFTKVLTGTGNEIIIYNFCKYSILLLITFFLI